MRNRLLILLLLVSVVCQAQHKRYGKLVASMPFYIYHSGVMVVMAKLENYPDSLRFILDTGSSGASLDSATCALKGITTMPTNITVSGIGARRKVDFVYDKSLDFEGITMAGFNFHVNDYEVLTNIYGEKIDGILGLQFFRRFTILCDFEKSKIYFYEKGSFNNKKFRGRVLKTSINGIPLFQTPMTDNKKFNPSFYFDSGAGLCILLSDSFIRDSSVLQPSKKIFNTQVEGMNGIINMKYTVINEMNVSGYRFKKVPTFVYQDVYNVLNYPSNHGLVGNDLLRRFNYVVDYSTGEFLLKPNKHFKDPFDYSYTGLNIFKFNGQVFIESVIEGSPAEKAGLLSGDLVIGINLNFSGNLQQYRMELQQIGDHRIFVERAGGMEQILLRSKSIL